MTPIYPQATKLADAVRIETAKSWASKRPRVYFTVTPNGFMRWAVHTGNAIYESKTFFLQYRAIAWARSQAKKIWDQGTRSGVRIKGKNGQYREEWSYGEDPPESPG